MTTIYNGQQQLDLMRAIALRALMNASGDNCYCPVKRPTKFIVTLTPILKVPDADPFINLQQQQTSSCTTCNNLKPQKKPTAEQIQVRNNVEALKGKTILNAFRVLTNSKFITIDPKYDYGENILLSPSGEKIRLTGGGLKSKENSTKVSKGQTRLLQTEQSEVKLEKPARKVYSNESQGQARAYRNERIYRILEQNYNERNSTKTPLKCRIVCHGEHATVEKRKKPKARKEKTEKKEPKEPTNDRELLRKELEQEPVETEVPPPPLIPPTACEQKAVGMRDEPESATQQQNTLDVFGWDPLKYFGLTCTDPKKTTDELSAKKPPCPLAMFPFPSIRKVETAEEPQPPEPRAELEQTRQPVKEQLLPCADREVFKPRPEPEPEPEPKESCHALEDRHLPRHEELHKPRGEANAPDISNTIIAHQCNRIHNLELQVNQLRRELGRMRSEIIPPDEMLRCTALTSKLRELTVLLADLKNRHAAAIAEVILAQKQAKQNTKCIATAESTQVSEAAPSAPPPRPQMKTETVQTYFPSNHIDKLSQTNASFGWRPFIDEATQSSPPSTVAVTPKNTSSVPVSSLTSSAASSTLPCRHGTGEIPLKESPSFCPYCQQSELPRCTYVERNLCDQIMALLQCHMPCDVLLSVLLQPNNLYHINIAVTCNGEPLGCIYATEHAINEAVEADVFSKFLTFFIVDARISAQQKDKILAHTFEFFKN